MMYLEGESPQGPLPKWGGGVVAPLACLGYAVFCLVRGEARLGRGTGYPIYGGDVVVYALALFCVAWVVHVHFFWGNSERLEPYAGLGKVVGMVGFVACMILLGVRLFRP